MRPWRVLTHELFERAWLQCIESDRYDVAVLLELFDSIEDGLSYNPMAIGQPHPSRSGLWVYQSPPLDRIPKVYCLYEPHKPSMVAHLWAAKFP